MSYLCPSCGRIYEERPVSGGCLDCDGVAVVEALRSANKRGLGDGLAAFETAKRARNAFVLVGLALGGGAGALMTFSKGGLLLLVAPLIGAALGAGIVWGIGTAVWDRSRGLWQLRSRRSRVWVVTILLLSMAGMSLLGVLYVAPSCLKGVDEWWKESKREAGRSWTFEIRSQAATLAPCFDAQTLDTPLMVHIRWNEKDTVTATPASVSECVLKRATGWDPPSLGRYRCVICPFEVQRSDHGVGVFGPVPDDLQKSCVWTTSRNQCE